MAKLRKSGGYRTLASFQTSTLIYDATVPSGVAVAIPTARQYWLFEYTLDVKSRTNLTATYGVARR